MTIIETFIVTDTGFHQEAAQPVSQTLSPTDGTAQNLAQTPLPAMIRIPFDKFDDGRGFTLARQLRSLGYKGHLRATGHIIADQYAMARRAGFDDVEISAALAARQPWALLAISRRLASP